MTIDFAPNLGRQTAASQRYIGDGCRDTNGPRALPQLALALT